MLKLNSVMIGSAKPKALADFYAGVLGKPADWNMGGWYGWQTGETFFTVGEHSEVKVKAKEPQRIMFNLESRQVKREFARIKDLGAKVIKEPYQMEGSWIATLADPDGNYFQLNSPMNK